MSNMKEDIIDSYQCSTCFLCGSEGTFLYVELKDRLFGAAGEWNFKKCRNPECGLIWIDPMPTEKDISKAYRNYYTHEHLDNKPEKYSFLKKLLYLFYNQIKKSYISYRYNYQLESFADWEKYLGILMYFLPTRKAKIDFDAMYLHSQVGGHLLDIGCGNGQKLEMMQQLGWQTEGLDIDPIAIKKAKKKGMKVYLGTLKSQKYPNDYFDAITMSHIIEHVHDPLKTLQECKRILKPGKLLIVVTPNSKSWGHKLYRDSWLSLDPPRHLHIFSDLTLRALTEKAGFKKIRIFSTIRAANNLFIASRNIQNTGLYKWRSNQSCYMRIWAEGMQFIEWIILKIRPDLGEEIVLIGEK